MRNIHQDPCGVIPKYMLQNAASHSDDTIASGARGTLQQMEALASGREEAITPIQPAAATLRMQRNIHDTRHRLHLPGKPARPVKSILKGNRHGQLS